MNLEEFLSIESKNREIIKVSMNYIDMTEDLVSGLLLSQIVFWFLPNKQGQKKVRIKKQGKEWIAKKREDWWQECRITPKQVDRSLKKLSDLGYIEKKIFRFNNQPTTHISVCWKHFLQKYHSISQYDFSTVVNYDTMYEFGGSEITQRGSSNLPKGKVGNYPKGKLEVDQRVKTLTETTTETTTENNILQSGDCDTELKKSQDNKKDIKPDLVVFNFNEKLRTMETSADQRMPIISLYWKHKRFNFDNQEQYSAGIKRELNASAKLKGYSLPDIQRTMRHLDKQDFKWTLETVHKYIDEIKSQKNNERIL